MSEASLTSTPPAGEPAPSEAALRRAQPRSYSARVLLRTLGYLGAQLGIAWLAVITIFAVFAPFLANSHPYLMKVNGRWSSPLLRHLTWADVSLLVAFFAALVLLVFFRRARLLRRFLIFMAIVAVTIALSLWLVRPPRAVVYDQYRVMEKEGKVEFVIRAPIPYSPTDRLIDRFDPNLPHPWPPTWVYAMGQPWMGQGDPPPWHAYLLGTERNGADIASRMIHASRIALAIGFIAEGIAVVIGVTIGGLMGYFGGLVDLLGMRLVEVFSAIPSIYLLLTFVAFFERNIYLIMVIIGLTSWVGFALFTRAEFLRLRNQDFVQAAQALGLPLRSILFKHMLPNGMSPILVSLSFGIASAILAETTLSFLGLGLVDEPSWGQLLNQALSSGGRFVWWLAAFPGLVIFFTVFAYNLIGEALRDAVDPRLQHKL